ncbi:uncharacterized protein LOC121711194 [Alosa sapidissima]|uniref:uncharacterized protein LOC121711192 n=1 Tax=Alosa sapidissima TaxID=34773 RepID=UPI001C0960D1|nr:uncharacterized protein LOC121711192 [Alosa sapidissima]XP_041950491.1 uncharacterized protein LOC121711194 [Alosa sapidissima]
MYYNLNAFPKLKRKQSDHRKRSEQEGGSIPATPQAHHGHTSATHPHQGSDPLDGVSGGSDEEGGGDELPEENPEEENVVPFADIDFYQCLLLETERVLVIGGGTIFVLNHFNTVTKCLDNEKLMVVERKAVVFEGSSSYIYKCSCDFHHGRLVEALSDHLEQSFHETSCIHVKALTRVLHNLNVPEVPMNQEDDHNYACSLYNESMVLQIPFAPSHFVVLKTKAHGIVKAHAGTMKCQTCNRGNTQCGHVRVLQDCLKATGAEGSAVRAALRGGGPYQDVRKLAVSSKPIPFDLPIDKRIHYSRSFVMLERNLEGVILLQSNVGRCDCGHSMSATPKDVYIYSQSTVAKAILYQQACESCGHQQHFDGGDEFLLNMGTYVVHHEVLRDYFYHFLNSSSTMYNYLEVYNTNMLDRAVPESIQITYRKFRDAVLSFMDLMTADFADGFKCPVCKDKYTAVVMDGTSLGYQQKYALKRDGQYGTRVANSGSSHPERVLVSSAPLRKLLTKFVDDGLTPAEAIEMEGLAERHSAFLLPLLQACLEVGMTCVGPCRRIVQEVAKNSPACALLHPSERVEAMVQDLEAMGYTGVEGHPQLLKTLAEECPLFFQMVGAEGAFPEVAVPIFRALHQKARGALMKPALDTPLTTMERDGDFFPCLPLVRDRGLFDADGEREQGRLTDCRKVGSRHPSLIPGIFTLFCKHGVCLGFSIMEQVESVNVPFSILRSRFTKCPEVVIYDNACQLHTYAIRRDPQFFNKTWFLVNRLHWRNHSGIG